MKKPPTQSDATGPESAPYGKIQVPRRSQYQPEWRARLIEAGYPTAVVVLDFETYFDEEFTMRGDKLSTVEYICDERFEVLGLAWLEVANPFEDYEAQTRFSHGEQTTRGTIEYLQRRYGPNLEKCVVVAHNAPFDAGVLSFRYGITPPYLIDVMGLARHWNSRTKNDLDSLAKRWELPLKGDTVQFKGYTNRKRYQRTKRKRKKKAPPQPRPKLEGQIATDLAEYASNDVKREWELFCLLLPLMSNHVDELRVMQHTLDLFLKPVLRVDAERAEDIRQQMEQAIDDAVAAVGDTVSRSDISGENKFEELLEAALREAHPEVDNPLTGYTKRAKNKKGWKFAIAKDDPEREQLENHRDPKVRALIDARNAVSSWPLHIKRLNRIVQQAGAAGGKLPVPLKYHGAHTGRWAGGEKINLQNLGSRGHELVTRVRETLVAPEGFTLVIADAAQIEPRVLAYLANQADLLEKFARDEDTYCPFAEKVLGVPVRKPRKDGIPAVEARHKFNRNVVGKVGILGCGYGMGAAKTVGYSQGALDIETAERVVQTYRSEHDRIVAFWYDLQRAFVYTARYGKPCRLSCGLKFHTIPGCDVVLTLPNGRELKYHKVRISGERHRPELEVWNDMEKHWVHIWGGYLTENVVQAVSRDVLWEAIDRLEQRGYHTALHVHDELILNVRTEQGQQALDAAIEELSRTPKWASGLPLSAEGLINNRYGDH